MQLNLDFLLEEVSVLTSVFWAQDPKGLPSDASDKTSFSFKCQRIGIL